MRRKFLKKEGTLTLEDLFRIARSQEAVDRQMKVMISNAGADQVNVVGAGGGQRLGKFLCQNHPTKSDVTSG